MPNRAFMSAAALGSMLFGTAISVFNMFYWDRDIQSFEQGGGSPGSVSYFYLAEAISILLLLLGIYLAYGYLRSASGRSPLSSSLSVIGSALSDRNLVRIGVAATLLYGVLYAFTSSIVVVQPQVDFATTYGARGVASWSSTPCCGQVGFFPEVYFYVSPAHVAIQLVPLSLLLLFIVPPLVGLNLSLAIFSVRRTVAKLTGRWMVACGAAVGLFTACPTCAGFFLAESVGGMGATTLAVALAPYQAVFIAVSIPLLLATPLVFARRIVTAAASTQRESASSPKGPDGEPPIYAGNR